MGADTGQKDLATFEVNEEQRAEPTKRDGVAGEEVTRETAGSLSAEELGPRWS
jgi:hypothetical protein